MQSQISVHLLGTPTFLFGLCLISWYLISQTQDVLEDYNPTQDRVHILFWSVSLPNKIFGVLSLQFTIVQSIWLVFIIMMPYVLCSLNLDSPKQLHKCFGFPKTIVTRTLKRYGKYKGEWLWSIMANVLCLAAQDI